MLLLRMLSQYVLIRMLSQYFIKQLKYYRKPTFKSLEETLSELKIKDIILKKHFQKWKDRFNRILQSIDAVSSKTLSLDL